MEMTKDFKRIVKHKIFSIIFMLGLIYYISETYDKLDMRRYLKVSPMH